MTECQSEEMRDRLPELAHGALSAAAEARVRAHAAGCAECSAELALLKTARQVLVANGPRVDVTAIVAAVTAPTLTVVRGDSSDRAPRRGTWMPRRYLAAAASLLVIGALALPSVRRAFDGVPGTLPGDSLADLASASPDANGLALSGGLADLSDDDLATLLSDLEVFEATIASEPSTLRSPLVDSPEGP